MASSLNGGGDAWTWSDNAGDGIPQDGQVKHTGLTWTSQASHMIADQAGNVWFLRAGKIYEMPLQGLDPGGNPIYRWSKVVQVADVSGMPVQTFEIGDDGIYVLGIDSRLGPSPSDSVTGNYSIGGCNALVKLDLTGKRLWEVPLPKPSNQLDTAPGGGAVVGQNGGSDLFLIDGSGQLINRVASATGGDWLDFIAGAVTVERNPGDGILDVFAEGIGYGESAWYRIDDRAASQPLSAIAVAGQVVRLDTSQTPPHAPVLDPGSDTGVKGDGITASKSPSFDVSGADSRTVKVVLLRGTRPDGSDAVAVASIAGNGTIADPKSLADGTYYYFTEKLDLAGNSSPLSPAARIQILTTLPRQTLTIALLPADDSSNRWRITYVKQPHFTGVAPVPPAAPAPGYTITLIDVTNAASPVVLNSIPDPNTGNYIIQTPSPLKDGTYRYAIIVSDVAANTETSNVVTFTIKTTKPTNPPALDIVPADVVPPASTPAGTGRTTVRQPHLEGVTDPGAIVKLYTIDGTLQATAFASTAPSGGHPAGYFTARLPFNLSDGTVQLYTTETDLANNQSGRGPTFTLNITTAPYDFNNAGRADIGVFHPSTATWYIDLPNQPQVIRQFGFPNVDIPVPGDYDGDGNYDLAVFRPTTDQWFISGSTTGLRVLQFGYAGHDTPVPAGYDTVGQSEVAVYRPGTGQWFILHNTAQGGTSQQTVGFGFANLDVPVPADYAGAGYAELAVFRPTTGDWIFYDPKAGTSSPTINLGHQAGDVPVPADYDGIGRAEPALYRPSTGQFIVYNPIANQIRTVAVAANGVPAPEDYSGDGKVDPGVFMAGGTGSWMYVDSASGSMVRVGAGATGSDVALAASSYDYRVRTGVPTPVVATVAAPTPAGPAIGSSSKAAIPASLDPGSGPAPQALVSSALTSTRSSLTSSGKVNPRPNSPTKSMSGLAGLSTSLAGWGRLVRSFGGMA